MADVKVVEPGTTQGGTMNVRIRGTTLENVPITATRKEIMDLYRDQLRKQKGDEMRRRLNQRLGLPPSPEDRAEEQRRIEEQVISRTSPTGRQWMMMGAGMADIGRAGLKLGGKIGLIDPATIAQEEDAARFATMLEQNTPGGEAFRAVPGVVAAYPFARGAVRPAATAVGEMAKEALIGGGLGYAVSGGGGPEAAVGSALGGVGGAVSRTANFLNPKNWLARSIQKSEQTGYAQEGARLSKETGIPLTPAQETGNKMMGYLEAAARQSLYTADKVADADAYAVKQAQGALKRLADKLSARDIGPEQMGNEIRSSLVLAVRQMDKLRDAAASRDYGKLRAAAGDKPIITMNNFVVELGKIIDDYAAVGTPEAQRIVAQANAMRAKYFADVPVTLKVEPARKTRSYYGKAAKGDGTVFDEVNAGLNRQIAGRLYGALQKDFEDAETVGGNLGALLKTANSNYKSWSDSIKFVEKGPLGNYLGEELADAAVTGIQRNSVAGEAIAHKMMNSLRPSEVAAVTATLKQVNPQLVQDLKSYTVRQAWQKGLEVNQAAIQRGDAFSYANVLRSVPQEDWLKAAGWSAAEIKDLYTTVGALSRASQRFGYNYSGTAPLQEAMSASAQIGGAVADAATGGLSLGMLGRVSLSVGGKVIGLNKIASAMSTPEGRRAIRTITSPSSAPGAVAKAFTLIEAEED